MNYYIVDAFTNENFKGNPAGVCILDSEASDKLMQSIAAENNLSETAFAYKNGEEYKLKWFTPKFEIDLCGHATLATAHIICTYVEPRKDKVIFDTISGKLEVRKRGNLYEMKLPLRIAEKIEVTSEIIEALGVEPVEVFSDRDLYIVMKSEKDIKEFIPNYDKLQSLNKWLGVAITSKGTDVDFVSRYFCPELKIEDPVTGSTHCSLVHIWEEKLNKKKFLAKQLSERGGVLQCTVEDTEVKISGEAILYLKGQITLVGH